MVCNYTTKDSKDALITLSGTCSIKAGYAGEEEPEFIIPSVVGKPRSGSITLEGANRNGHYVGKVAYSNKGMIHTQFIIQINVIGTNISFRK